MKKLIQLFLIIIQINTINTFAFSQACHVDSVYISPTSPDDQTSISIILKTSLLGINCTGSNGYKSTAINGNNYLILRDFCGGGGTPSCINFDTLNIGTLPTGNYSISNDIFCKQFNNCTGPTTTSCSYPTVQFSVSAFTGIKETNKHHFKISPNPSNGKILINELDYLKDGTISLMDMESRLIFQKPWNPLENEFDFGDIKQGIYFFNINTKDGINSTEKLILIK